VRLLTLTLLFVATAPDPSVAHTWQEALPLTIAEGPPRYSWSTTTTTVVLQFDTLLPAEIEVVRFARAGNDRRWHLAETIQATAPDGRTTLTGPIGVESLLLIRATGRPGYILDGPFRWPPKASTYTVRTDWRKTVRGSFAGLRGSLLWVSADDGSRPGYACEWVNGADWECVGVPLHALGLVVMRTTGEVKCGIPTGELSPAGVETASMRTTAWGRLVLAQIGLAGRPATAIRISAQRPHVPEARSLATHLEAVADARVHVDPIAAGVAWISGAEVPDDGWIEIAASQKATERIDIREVTGAPADVPLRVQLQPSMSLSGRVTNPAASPVPDTVLTLYRFIREDRHREKSSALRIAVAETVADSNGAFRFDGAAMEPYELVAIHPVFGRDVRRVTPDGRELAITLRSDGQAQ
jgi:hypothetical protein